MIRYNLLVITLIVFISIPLSSYANNNARLALVIGNAEYQIAPLTTPIHDAHDIAHLLEGFGFEVFLKTNLNKEKMKAAIREFRQRLINKKVGLFYFSGYALQHSDSNYLVPLDADLVTPVDIEFEAIDVRYLLRQLEELNNEVNIIILEACRNTPYEIKELKSGLIHMDSPLSALIAYAALPNHISSENKSERNSTYTKQLLKVLNQKPHLNITELLIEVGAQVTKITQNKQKPWQSVSLTQSFCFIDCSPSQCEQKIDQLFTQPYIDPLTKYIKANLGDEVNAECIQRIIQERDSRCKKIEKKYYKERKNSATLNKLKKGYGYSCPTVVENFANAVENFLMEQELVRLFDNSYVDDLIKYIEKNQYDESKINFVRRVQEELEKRSKNIEKYLLPQPIIYYPDLNEK